MPNPSNMKQMPGGVGWVGWGEVGIPQIFITIIIKITLPGWYYQMHLKGQKALPKYAIYFD